MDANFATLIISVLTLLFTAVGTYIAYKGYHVKKRICKRYFTKNISHVILYLKTKERTHHESKQAKINKNVRYISCNHTACGRTDTVI